MHIALFFSTKDMDDMDNCINNPLATNPGTLFSGIKARSHTLKTAPLEMRKLATLVMAISSRILSAGSVYSACDNTLISDYNAYAARFGVRQVKDRVALHKMRKRLEEAGYIIQQVTGHFRTIIFNMPGIMSISDKTDPSAFEKMISSAFNWAASMVNANQFVSKNNKGYQAVDKAPHTLCSKAFGEKAKQEKTTQRLTVSLDKKRSNKTDKPSDDFYLSRFGKDAGAAKHLQTKARVGTLSTHEAFNLVEIHTKHGVRIGDRFRRFLNTIIGKPRKARLE